MKKVLITSVFIASVLLACKSSKETAATTTSPAPGTVLDCKTQAVMYADVQSIIETNCSKCHNANQKGGFNALDLASVKSNATSGKLLGTIKHSPGFAPMPARAAQLDQASINKIECWINNGMK
jgi:cytochrome c5